MYLFYFNLFIYKWINDLKYLYNNFFYIICYLMDICKLIKKAWRNYTWFSMVAMNGEKGDKQFNKIYNNE